MVGIVIEQKLAQTGIGEQVNNQIRGKFALEAVKGQFGKVANYNSGDSFGRKFFGYFCTQDTNFGIVRGVRTPDRTILFPVLRLKSSFFGIKRTVDPLDHVINNMI